MPVEFLEAVQPSEVVVGMITKGRSSRDIYEVERIYSESKLEGSYGKALFAKGFVGIEWIGEKQVTITDDTNAIYEVQP